MYRGSASGARPRRREARRVHALGCRAGEDRGAKRRNPCRESAPQMIVWPMNISGKVRQKMGLSDELIERKRAADAAAAVAKAEEVKRIKAVGTLLSKIEDILEPAKRAGAVTLNKVPVPLANDPRVTGPSLTISFSPEGPVVMNPVTVRPEGRSRVEIQGGAVVGEKIQLTWDGAGEELANWNISPQATARLTSGPKTRVQARPNQGRAAEPSPQVLTQDALEDALRRYLGLGKKPS